MSIFDSLVTYLKSSPIIRKALAPVIKYYREYKLGQERKRMKVLFNSYGIEALKKFDECMTTNGYKYTLMVGTLLGAIREKGFIKHDLDIDTAMWISDFDPSLYDILEKAGFKRKFSYSVDDDRLGKEDSFIYKGINIDIFYFYPAIDKYPYFCDFVTFPEYKGTGGYAGCADEFGGLLPRRLQMPYSNKTVRVPFEGTLMLPVPDNANELLEFRYGKDYMIPNPQWSMLDKNSYTTEWVGKVASFKVH